jgi:hypothetical protein
MTTNINGVCISYSVAECPVCGKIPWDACLTCKGSGHVLTGVTVRGEMQDLRPILKDSVISNIESLVKMTAEFQRECARQDEGVKVKV